jgi:formylglycine-generating enzyme required for sulfatase activity
MSEKKPSMIEMARAIANSDEPDAYVQLLELMTAMGLERHPEMPIVEDYFVGWLGMPYNQDAVTCIPGGWVAEPKTEFQRRFIDKWRMTKDWILVPGGKYISGSPDTGGPEGTGEWSRFDDEKQKERDIGSFILCDHPVTQQEWLDVMGKNPSEYQAYDDEGILTTGDHPVEKVSYFDCCIFCNNRSKQKGEEPPYHFLLLGEEEPKPLYELPARPRDMIMEIYVDDDSKAARLPGEWEWEYAARAPWPVPPEGPCWDTVATWNGPLIGDEEHDFSVLDPIAHYYSNRGGVEGTKPVKTKRANPFGLHDNHGNVWEWTADEYKAKG